ncbi:hypothetical protein CS022_00495 [Veronia nyctiphanis]|uniref:Uncharacterized protein n=1 Tax=Veronia nyctiphanis TaxID=1278244 RepID=A0A4V1LTC8_9GAMM|nr:hypothetical protein CS022_00495 [Veronia nyctiphanis]
MDVFFYVHSVAMKIDAKTTSFTLIPRQIINKNGQNISLMIAFIASKTSFLNYKTIIKGFSNAKKYEGNHENLGKV